MSQRQIETPAAVTVGTSWTTLLTLMTGADQGQLRAEVENAGAAQAFSDFRVQAQDHPDGEWYALLSAGEVEATVAPGTLATVTKTHITVSLIGLYAIRLQAKVAADTTTANVKGSVAQAESTDDLAALKNRVAPLHEVPGAPITAGATEARTVIPPNAVYVEVTARVDEAQFNFVESDTNAAQVGRILLVNSVSRLRIPTAATRVSCKRVTSDATLNPVWLTT